MYKIKSEPRLNMNVPFNYFRNFSIKSLVTFTAFFSEIDFFKHNFFKDYNNNRPRYLPLKLT